MAKAVSKITLGVDVAKDEHAIRHWNQESVTTLPNQREDIRRWLGKLQGPVQIAIEPTSHYHLTFVEVALELGCEVYLVNPRQLAHYREAVNVRNKTDFDDASLLARYLVHEVDQLRPFRPQCPKARRLWSLLLRRATVVRSRQQLQQSFREVKLSIRALTTQINHLLHRLERQIQCLIRDLGWWNDYLRCQTTPGIGPATAAALVATYHRGVFASSDAFIAYLGLDIRHFESGRFKGRSKLSKRGEPELRRLLYCASRGALSHLPFEQYRQAQLDKGRSKIAARVALARKLARIAFTLLERKEVFRQPT